MKHRERRDVYRRLLRVADHTLKLSSACSACPISAGVCQNSKTWCCGGCPFTSPTGCTTQALGCKLHLCGEETNRQYKLGHKFARRMWLLQLIAFKYKIWVARANEELSLEHGDKDFWYVYYTYTGPNAPLKNRREICERFSLPQPSP